MTQHDLLAAILPDIPFDGWSEAAFARACRSCGITPAEGRALAPRGAIDLAVLYHHEGDAALRARANASALSDLRYSERVAALIAMRLEVIEDPEAVQRATTLFALPHLAPEGARLIWSTADTIWDILGDTSRDVNWYTKRMTLSAVWSSVLLYWLGDTSDGKTETRAFIDRRIADVMAFEKTKARLRDNRITRAAFSPIASLLSQIKAPTPRDDLPGAGYARR